MIKRYVPNSKIIEYKHKNTENIYEIEVIGEASDKLLNIKDKVLSDLRYISKEAGQDPEDYVSSWFKLASLLILVRSNDKLCGFAIAYHDKPNLIHFPVVMIVPEHQNLGLSNFITALAIKNFLFQRIKIMKYKVWDYLKPVYFVFRTQNPILYTMLSRKVSVFPSIIKNKIPSEKEIKLAQYCAKKFWSNCDFDAHTFVLKGAYTSNPKLMFDPKNIPWSKNSKVNKYFEKNLGLTNKAGHALLTLGKVSFFGQLTKVIINR